MTSCRLISAFGPFQACQRLLTLQCHIFTQPFGELNVYPSLIFAPVMRSEPEMAHSDTNRGILVSGLREKKWRQSHHLRAIAAKESVRSKQSNLKFCRRMLQKQAISFENRTSESWPARVSENNTVVSNPHSQLRESRKLGVSWVDCVDAQS